MCIYIPNTGDIVLFNTTLPYRPENKKNRKLAIDVYIYRYLCIYMYVYIYI